MVFANRTEAGRQLAGKLQHYRDKKPYVVALPRGGVLVGYEIAQALHAPLDIIVARKLGAPGHPEMAFGAVAPNGVRVLDRDVIRLMDVSDDEVNQITGRELIEVDRRLHRYRRDMPMPDISGKTVIVVSDGLATGLTALAAIRAIRKLQPGQVVLAVPVAPPEALDLLGAETDDTVCLDIREDFASISESYRQFGDIQDEEVILLLDKAQQVEGSV